MESSIVLILVVVLVCAALVWLINQLPGLEPFRSALLLVVVAIGILVLLFRVLLPLW
jgi:hypothetical protein